MVLFFKYRQCLIIVSVILFIAVLVSASCYAVRYLVPTSTGNWAGI